MENKENANIVATSLSTIFASTITKFVNIDNTMYGPIHTLCVLFFKNIMSFDTTTIMFFNKSTISYASVIIFFFVIIALFIIIKIYCDTYMYTCFVIHDDECIKTFNKYTKYYPDFYNKNGKLYQGHPDIVGVCSYDSKLVVGGMGMLKNRIPQTKRTFYDKNFYVSGYYKSDIYKSQINDRFRSIDKTVTVYVTYIELYISKLCKLSAEEYFEKVMKHAKNKIDSEKKLYHRHIIPDDDRYENLEYMFCDKNKEIINKNIYIDTFFHDKKNELINLLETVHNEPEKFKKFGQVAKAGLLLHGPPGTGKSNFALRMAQYLGRHIVSNNIKDMTYRDIITNIKQVWIHGSYKSPKEIIFLFDEFDETIVELKNRQIQKEAKYRNNENKLNLPREEILLSLSKMNSTEEKKDGSNNEEKKEKISINELLEVLHGAVPLEGAIFIATTNKYNKIFEICPALVRHGRLTPYLFDNFNGKILNEISVEFFGQSFEFEQNMELNIMNSQIMEWVVRYKDIENGFNKLKEEILNAVKKIL